MLTLPIRRLRSGASHALVPSLLVVVAACCACRDGAEAVAGGGTEAVSEAELEREIRDLINAVTPLDASAAAGEKSSWFPRRKLTLERMREGSQALGLAALEAYRARDAAIFEVRVGLLDIASHCAPEETRPVLVDLVSNYGDDLGVRKAACGFLGKTSPEVALELLAPILLNQRPGVTYPPSEAILKAWLEAADRAGHDATDVLATVTTDLRQEFAARHLAVRELGDRPSDAGRQALETVLVESTGNNYVRRMAAQSLQKTLEPERLCALLQKIAEREADVNFQQFVASMLETYCR